jgi:hypothetical protein
VPEIALDWTSEDAPIRGSIISDWPAADCGGHNEQINIKKNKKNIVLPSDTLVDLIHLPHPPSATPAMKQLAVDRVDMGRLTKLKKPLKKVKRRRMPASDRTDLGKALEHFRHCELGVEIGQWNIQSLLYSSTRSWRYLVISASQPNVMRHGT